MQLETRQAQLFMPIYAQFYDDTFQEKVLDINYVWEYTDFEDFQLKYGFNDTGEYAKWVAFACYLEGIGVLLKRGLIDASMVDDLMSGMITHFWDKYKPLIMESRTSLNWSIYAEYVEYLYNEITRIAAKG